MAYQCKKCKHTFNQKCDYDRHINRKTDCVTGSKTNKKVSTFKCHYCKKAFTRKSSRDRHNKTCKKNIKNKISSSGKKNINIQGDKNKTIGDHNTIIKNSKIENNGSNIIILNIFAKDGTKNLSHDEIGQIFKSNKNAIEEIISLVNLNPNKPQHHNIYINDLKSSYCEVYEEDGWVKKKINEMMEILVDTKVDDLNKILSSFEGIIKKDSIDKIKDAIEKHNISRRSERKKLKSYLKPIFYNNRKMILKTRKLSDRYDDNG